MNPPGYFAKMNIWPINSVYLENAGKIDVLRRARFLLAGSLSILSISSNSALAQSVLSDEKGAEFNSNEIIVTAQRRAENIQKVPISVAAVSAQNLENANISSVLNLGQLASNFQAMRAAQSATVRLNIRGIGAAGNNAVEPSVAVFLDGVYVPRGGAAVNTMLDIAGVEVLRGPQGTLFGRNASVGALSLRTALPQHEFSGALRMQAATGDDYRIEGHVNIPVTPNVAVRLSGLQRWFGGYWHNRLDGRQLGGKDDTAFRVVGLADIGDFTWTVRGDYMRSAGDGIGNMDLVASSVTPADLEKFRNHLGGILPDTNLNDRKMNQYVDADFYDRQWGVSSTLEYHGDGINIKLTNSFRDWKMEQTDGDTAYLPIWTITRQSEFRSKSYNNEIQFGSPDEKWLNGNLTFVGGLYQYSEKYSIDDFVNLGDQWCRILLQQTPEAAVCQNELMNSPTPQGAINLMHQKTDSFAVYAQGTYDLTDQIGITLGGRWNKDKKSGRYDGDVTTPYARPIVAPEHLALPGVSEKKFTYRIGLNYNPTDDIMIFATYSTGYKSGGYNSGSGNVPLSKFAPDGTLISTSRVFGSENVKNYEIGAKTSWLDRAVTANITFYRMDLAGYQDRSFDGTSFTVRNAGNLRQQGFEFDGSVTPIRGFSVNAQLAYLDSAFTSFPGASGWPGLGGVQDMAGKPATYSPKWTGNIGLQGEGNIGTSGLGWQFNTNLSFVSEQFMGAVTDGNPQTLEPGAAYLSAKFSIHGADDRWTVSVFGTNLTGISRSTVNYYQILDALFNVRNSIFPGSSAIRKMRNDPRTVGVAFGVRF